LIQVTAVWQYARWKPNIERGTFLLQLETTISTTQWYEILSSFNGPVKLSESQSFDPLDLNRIIDIHILAGTRKASFISAYIKHNVRTLGRATQTAVDGSAWSEDLHKDRYQMSGISPALKVGVGPLDLTEGQVRLATDVTIKVDGQQKHRNLTSDIPYIKSELVNIFSKDRTVGVKSQVAGLGRGKDGLVGIVMSPSMVFTTSRIPVDKVVSYVESLDDGALRRSPGSILWPHPSIEPHITSISGVGRESEKFTQLYVDLLQHLLGVPNAIRLLVSALDHKMGVELGAEDNLFGKIDLVEQGLLGPDEKFEGNWQELVKDNNGDILTLRNARPGDYVQMSDIAIRNFKEAPNYQYLQSEEGRSQQEKYIAANSPEGIKDLCGKPNNVCNLVVEKDGEILGFRVIRKNDDVADGRRMHTSLLETGRGIGGILLKKSEKIAKQVGCRTMEVHATGKSYKWFEKKGFINHGIRPNSISDYYLMIKEL
jgi:hypothetical protein